MATVADIIAGKASKKILSISGDASLLDAVNFMTEKKVGVVTILDGDFIAGVLSERDVVRALAKYGEQATAQTVQSIMTTNIFIVRPEDEVNHCMQIMTKKRVRHLPVCDADDKLVGIISIGDTVKTSMREQTFVIEQLERYIEGA